MDHRLLLKKYMRIIRFAEGGDYIPYNTRAYERLIPPLLFTEEELVELEALADENLTETNKVRGT